MKKSCEKSLEIHIFTLNFYALIPGARQEQDIFVRLIDSVTKQVKYSSIKITSEILIV